MTHLYLSVPDSLDASQRRAIERGAQRVQERVSARLDEEYAAHGDALRAAGEVADAEVRTLAAHGYPERVQEFGRHLVAYIAAPMVAAALLADEIPDTPAALV